MMNLEDLKNELTVRNVIDEINQKIDSKKDKVIVLNGGRGVGKTSVLLGRENDNAKRDDLSIYQMFDCCGKGFYHYEPSQELIECYYELEFAQHQLSYIRKNKPEVFTKFENFYNEIDSKRRHVLRCICNMCSSKFIVKKGDYVLGINDNLKEIFKKDKLTLMIDRFDWMDNRTVSSQKSKEKYFDMFDKVILTTDDEEYNSAYPTIDVNYGKDIKVVLEILKNYVILNNEKERFKKDNIVFPSELINENTINYLFTEANGNIELMKQVIYEYSSYYNALFTPDEMIEECRLLTDKNVKMLKKMKEESIYTRPMFHI